MSIDMYRDELPKAAMDEIYLHRKMMQNLLPVL